VVSSGDDQSAALGALDLRHGLPVIRFAAQEHDGKVAVTNGRGVEGMEPNLLHLRRDHADEDLLQFARKPLSAQGSECRLHKGYSLPEDPDSTQCRLGAGDDGFNVYVGQPVVQEGHGLQHVVTWLRSEHVDAQPGCPEDIFLRKAATLGVHQ